MEEWRFDGFPGRVLFVNLSEGTVEARSIPHAWCLEGMGGKGLATRVLVEWDTTEPAAYDLVHPITGGSDVARHPSTPLLVFTGPFQGTKVGSAGRAVVVSRSPLTDVYIDTYVGGNLGHRMREAGWDGLFLTGTSDALVRLEIDDLEARLVPCPELEGATTWACEQALDGLGECFSIGPGGEACVRFASPITAGRRAAGRGGTGAQFGFKRLKAITVNASAKARQLARIHDPDALAAAVKVQRQEMGLKRRAGDPFYAFGTSRGPLYASAND
ncbi:MAG: aldehyde ferredoxin oxidoreductase N-terminal domain-containing protein, partial [Candidatus Thermoplasmatota archaeon]|nr:aldehyde ferredoxin oxidoreductase N-terminal domain-containing protein [Candidatus Thermoplasmatota archaeon]